MKLKLLGEERKRKTSIYFGGGGRWLSDGGRASFIYSKSFRKQACWLTFFYWLVYWLNCKKNLFQYFFMLRKIILKISILGDLILS